MWLPQLRIRLSISTQCLEGLSLSPHLSHRSPPQVELSIHWLISSEVARLLNQRQPNSRQPRLRWILSAIFSEEVHQWPSHRLSLPLNRIYLVTFLAAVLQCNNQLRRQILWVIFSEAEASANQLLSLPHLR